MNYLTESNGPPPAADGLGAYPHQAATALAPTDPSGLRQLDGGVPEQHGAPRALDGRRPAQRDTVSVVIPALNEEPNIAWVLERLPAFVDEIVLVDGHSVDRTVAVARAIRRDVVVVTQNGGGKGAALRAGFAAARGDIIVMIDADGSMNPAEIDQFVTPLLNGYDLVKGSRFLDHGGSLDFTVLRRVGNQALTRLTNSLFLIRFSDLCYGFCSFRKECLPALALTAHGFDIETELVVHAVKANLRIAEVPSIELRRRCGQSNLRTFHDGQLVLRALVRERMAKRPRPVVDPIDQRALYHWRPLVTDVLGQDHRDRSLGNGALP
jgi:glycosyltransferase involved in cell wall biosynthesis